MGAEAAVKPETEVKMEGEQPEDENHEQAHVHAKHNKSRRPTVSYFELYKFGTEVDYILMLLGFVGACIHGASVPVASYLFGKLVDSVGTYFLFPELLYHDARKYALYFVYVGIATLFSAWLEVSCWTHTGERQAARMRIEYLKALLSQDVGFYDTESSIGEIINGFSNDTILVHESIGEQVGTFVHHVFRFFTAYGVSFYLSWQLTLLTISVVPLIAIAGASVAYIIVSLSNNSRKSYEAASEVVGQVLGQIRTVYAFVGERRAVKSYEEALNSSLTIGKKMGLAKGMGIGLIYGIQTPIWALLLWYAKHLVQKGDVKGSPAFITIFNAVVGGASLGLASSSLSAFGKGKVAGYTILELIRRTPADSMKHHGGTLQVVKGVIEFQNVHFSYPSRPNVVIFQDLCLVIPAGKQVALVGESGSGKSTVISLVERFYDPQSGCVLLDGHDTRELQLKWLRSQIGLVSQEPALFATSIRENILFGKEDGTIQEIEKAAELSNSDVFISKLPNKYETQVGERGVQLSGGQKQRIAIARAMIRNPPILLLDEATSALDSDSEKSVQDALDAVMQGRTCVIVAHRLSSVKDADIIAVLSHGKVVEMGTHDELVMKEGGAYAALVKIQADGLKKIEVEVKEFESGRHSRASSLSLTEKVFSFRLSGRSDLKSLHLEDMKLQHRSQISPATLQKLIKLSAPDWMVGLMGSVSAIIAGSSLPWITIGVTQALVSFYSFVPGYMNSEVRKICLIFSGASVPVFLACLGEHFFFGIMGENTTFRVRIQMLTAILRNEIGWFDDESNSSASIGSKLASDAVLVRSVVADLLSTVIHNLSLVVTAVVLAFVQQWRISLIMVATFPITVGANWLQFKFVRGFGGDLVESYSAPNRIAGEAVGNIRTVAAFCSEEKIVGLFSKELRGPGKKGFQKGLLAGFSFGLSQCCMFCAYGLTLWYGAKLISHRVISLGAMLKSFTVLLITSFAFAETLVLAPNIMRGFRSVGSVFDVVERQTLIDPDDPNAEEVVEVKGLVELKGVKFSYPSRPEVTIFENLNLKVKAGRSIALVGSSGSGKSSVIALIARFYDPVAGKVMVDGKDIKKMKLKSLRRHIGLVQQEPTLFAGTIYENIVYGREGAKEAEVVEAAVVANAHGFISGLPKGYETMVGEKGVQLSGGQKQRVAIARAVLRRPKVLLLDEATSALDAEAERVVQAALDGLMRRESHATTVIVVAHRLSSIQNADAIAVLEGGSLREYGSHASLLAKNGTYARLINLQCTAASNNGQPLPHPPSSLAPAEITSH